MNFLKSRPRSRSRKASFVNTLNASKWRNSRRISRLDSILVEEEEEARDDDNGPQYKQITDWVQEFFERKSQAADTADQDIEVHLTKKQTLILSTLVPDEILLMDKFDTSVLKRFVGVLMMADVSGYTALSEHYNKSGKGGTYRLTVTLNTYLGSLIELIYSHGGDIIKFAGDAFLALWKTDKRTFLCHTIHTVITCALIIQHSYASYETDVKINLKVKLAISAGNIIFAPIGSGIDMNYIIFGLPVLEAKEAESVCASGEVKLTPSAWGHCYSRNYDHVIDDQGYVTIKCILYDPRDSNVTKPFAGLGSMLRRIKRPFGAIESLPDCLWDSSKELSAADILKKTEALSLRKTILLAEEKQMGFAIRKFMIMPVLTQVDAHQPLEYLTEMRQVSILFITLKPKEYSFTQLITIVNNAYQITCEIVYKSMGCVNKIILFDKDVMMLVIFGLRGFKHESEAQIALKCAYTIKRSLSALDGVSQVSIGVTSGPVYCGVVGHPLRREYTVIGAIVNKAARLMCEFSNKITCDETTYIKSKMSVNSFTLQPPTQLKGIVKSGKIYEYSEEIRVKELYDIPTIAPLLDRVDEIEYFESWLAESGSKYRDFDALLIVGDPRSGKSRILEWMSRCAKHCGFRVCSINLTSIHSATPYLALSQIIDQILQLKEPIEGFIKEEKIVQLLNAYSDDLCYLNNIIKVRFAYHEGIHVLDDDKRREHAILIFTKLIRAIKEKHVIILDDLQNLDSFSWEFISEMCSSLNIFMVLSVTKGKISTVHNWLYSVFFNSNIRKMFLSPLNSEWIPALTCQILDVDGVAEDLCRALQSKCKGIPGLVESFILHLFSTGALNVKDIPNSEIDEFIKTEQLNFPNPEFLHPQALDEKDQITLDQFIQNETKENKSICIVTEKEELKTDLNVQNLNALIMIQIDSLTPYQQLLLKIASVIGNVVSRDLLENIMYENNWLITAKAIKRLFALNLLICANADYSLIKWGRKVTTSKSTNDRNIACDCQFDYIPEDCENIPKYAFCKLMAFRNKNTRITCYELLPINQKKEFHTRIVNYLVNNKQKCNNCGGKIMLIHSSFTALVNSNSSDSNLSDPKSSSVLTHKHSDTDDEKTAGEPTKATTMLHHNTDEKISFQPILKVSEFEDPPGTSTKIKTTKKVTLTTSDNELPEHEEKEYKIFDMLRAITEADDLTKWHDLGISDSQEDIQAPVDTKRSFTIKIEKGVSETDFAKCTCAELGIKICEQVIYHARQAELNVKAIEYLIKFCYLCMLDHNIDTIQFVFPKLDEAEEMCRGPNNNLNSFEVKRFLGKIYSLRAAACLFVGKLTAAKMEIDRATKIYHINLHKVAEYLKLSKIIKMVKLQQKKYRSHAKILDVDSIYCLNIATLLYEMLGEERISKTTALHALNIIKTDDCPVVDVCDTYSNAIQMELDRGTPEITAHIEEMAVQTLRQLPNPIKADELLALGKLLMATFHARMCRGELAASIRSGYQSLTISRFIQAEKVILEIIPDLFYILLARRRIDEAVDILQCALRTSEYHYISHECETWYYALCIDMILDAGLQIESPQDISRFAEFGISRRKTAGDSRRRLIVGLWTYWLRVGSEKAKYFESEALSWLSHEDDVSMTALLSAMRLAEGMLESLARRVEDLRKVVDLMELRSIADRELSRQEMDARLIRAIFPRWIRLKGNTLKLSGRHAVAHGLFNQALEEARRIDNRLEESLARAAFSNSKTWLQSARAGDFQYWREGQEKTRTAWHQLLYRISTAR